MCTPKPSIVRNDRGMPQSLMFQNTWCVASVCSDTKSKRVVCQLRLRDLPIGMGLAGVNDVGNLMPSWMKNTGMLLPTKSKLPSSV